MNVEKLLNQINRLPQSVSAILNTPALPSINELQKLKKEYPTLPWLEILTQTKLRLKAQKKFPEATEMLFTPSGYQQASSPLLAKYHYSKSLSTNVIADFCCGIGSDLKALAKNKKSVYALDSDYNSLLCAQYNCAQYNSIKYIHDSVENFQEKVDLIFADPDRRPDSSRTVNPEKMSPPFSILMHIFFQKKLSPRMFIKLAPALDYKKLQSIYFSKAGIFPYSHFCWEFISEKGILKEILLDLGTSTPHPPRKALLLPDTYSLSGTGNEFIPVTNWKNYILEPDNAVIRAGLVQKLGLITGSSLLDPHIALLTADQPLAQNFGKCYRVKDVFHWNKRKFQQYLNEHKAGELIIKTRGFPEKTESLKTRFKLSGRSRITVIIIRIENSHQAAVIEPLEDLTC